MIEYIVTIINAMILKTNNAIGKEQITNNVLIILFLLIIAFKFIHITKKNSLEREF